MGSAAKLESFIRKARTFPMQEYEVVFQDRRFQL